MKILLFGCNGQVGWELQRSLAVLGEVVALGRDAAGNPQGLCGDLLDIGGLIGSVRAVRPEVIVNAAAYTAVDKAESEPAMAHAVNALAPAALAEAAAQSGAWLVNYSSEHVFDGSGEQPWCETDNMAPVNVYGQSKRDGDRAVAQNPKHLILRTSWVHAARGDNFAKTILRGAALGQPLRVVDDQAAFLEVQSHRVEAEPVGFFVRICAEPQPQPAQGRRRQRCGETGDVGKELGAGRGRAPRQPAAPEQGGEGGQGQVTGEVRERLARPDQAGHDERQHAWMLTWPVSLTTGAAMEA